MDIRCLSSGSRAGNCYLISNNEAVILLDCGLNYRTLIKRLDFKLPDAVFVTHVHSDHSKALTDLLDHGVDSYINKHTADKLNIANHHRVHVIAPDDTIHLRGFNVKAFKVYHDVPTFNFIVADRFDKLVYLTDLGYCNFNFHGINHFLIEANHSEDALAHALGAGSLTYSQYERIKSTHLSFEAARDFLIQADLTACKSIILVHLSGRHGDFDLFRYEIQQATHVPTSIAHWVEDANQEGRPLDQPP